MAGNGHSNGNNNKAKSSTNDLNLEDRTESDATHIRLRNDRHPKSLFICQSCNRQFEGTSLIQIYEHYAENVHNKYFGLCFYCQGKVHQYYEVAPAGSSDVRASGHMQIYHNCLRWKRGENK